MDRFRFDRTEKEKGQNVLLNLTQAFDPKKKYIKATVRVFRRRRFDEAFCETSTAIFLMRRWIAPSLWVSFLIIRATIITSTAQPHSDNELHRLPTQEVSSRVDSLSIVSMLRQTYDALRSRNYLLADSLGGLAFTFASTSPYLNLLATAYRYNAVTAKNLSRYQEAEALNHKCIELAVRLGDIELTAAGYGNLANVYSHQGLLEQSITANFRALALYDSIGNRRGEAVTLNNIAIQYSFQSDESGALTYYQKARDLFLEIGDTASSSDALANVGISLLGLNRLEDGYDTLKKALGYAKQLDDPYLTATVSGAIGEYHYKKGNFRQAIEWQKKCLDQNYVLADTIAIIEASKSLSRYYKAIGKQEDALRYALSALKQAQRLGESSERYQLLFSIAELYEEKKAFKDALDYYKLSVAEKDSLLNQKVMMRTAELKTLYETEKKEKAIELLEKENLLKEATQSRERQLFFAVASIAIIIAGAAIVVGYQKDRGQKILLEKNKLIESQRNQLQDANALKDEFLAIATHDLKNPLQSIMGFSSLLKERVNSTELLPLITPIETASKRMLHLINELLDISALESGVIPFEKRPVILSEVIRETIESNQGQATLKQITLTVSHVEPVTVQGHYERLHEAIDNLISNAIKYSPPETTVSLSLALDRSRNLATLFIRDEGLGLTQDDLKKIFGRFQRLSSRPTAGESSTGLGLSIVKNIIELHGGRIWATSEGKGKGSTFHIELPLNT